MFGKVKFGKRLGLKCMVYFDQISESQKYSRSGQALIADNVMGIGKKELKELLTIYLVILTIESYGTIVHRTIYMSVRVFGGFLPFGFHSNASFVVSLDLECVPASSFFFLRVPEFVRLFRKTFVLHSVVL